MVSKQMGNSNNDALLSLAESIPSESNQTIKKFISLRKISRNALQSQGLVHLKTQYCEKHKCLDCAIGNALLGK